MEPATVLFKKQPEFREENSYRKVVRIGYLKILMVEIVAEQADAVGVT